MWGSWRGYDQSRSDGYREAGPRDCLAKSVEVAMRSEQINPKQASLLDELIDTYIAATVARQALQTPSVPQPCVQQG
jgi:hypothetical protein